MSWSELLAAMGGGFGLGILVQYELNRWGDRLRMREKRLRLEALTGDCGCDDGTEPDEPADRGFICPHDPRGMP